MTTGQLVLMGVVFALLAVTTLTCLRLAAENRRLERQNLLLKLAVGDVPGVYSKCPHGHTNWDDCPVCCH
jgi:hypothetical protein